MAKRGAGDQITRDDYDEDRGDNEQDPGERDQPLAPVAGRKIRGLPKRGGASAPAPAPTPSAEPAAKPAAFAGFSFGANTTPAPAAPAASPFSGFSFGQTSTSTAAPTTSFAAPAPAASVPAPFSGFSFTAPNPTSVSTQKSQSSTASTEPSTAKNPFAGISFGAKPSTSSPFSAAPAASTLSSTPFSFGQPNTATSAEKSNGTTTASTSFGQASAPLFGSSSSTNVTAKPAGNAENAAASTSTSAASGNAVASASQFPAESSTPATTSSKPAPSLASPPQEGEVRYYTSLRGLNVSTLSFITSTLEKDSFANLGDILPGLAEQYRKHLDEASAKSGFKPPQSTATSSSSSAASAAGSSTAFKPTATLPSVPSGGFTFGGQTSSKPVTGSSSTFGKGFTPTVPSGNSTSSSSPFSFSFGSKSAESTPKPVDTPKKPSADVSKLVQDVIDGKTDSETKETEEKKEAATAAKPFSFSVGSSNSIGTPSTDKKPTSSLFSFAPSGPLQPSTPDSKSFSPSANLESVSSTTPPAKLGKFGPGGSAPQLSFGGASATSSTPGAGKPTGFGFGAASSGSGGFSIGSSSGYSSTSPAPSFSFGSTTTPESSAPKIPSTGFSFSAPSPSSSAFGGAASSTPSFSFGQDAKKAAPVAPFSFGQATSGPAKTPAFGSNAVTSAPESANESAANSVDATAEATPEPVEPSVNLAEQGGVGEEGEDTLHESRAKLFKFADGKYDAVGLGNLKLKKNTETSKRRLLMRTDGSGMIILNMAVSERLDPIPEKTSVKFSGFDLTGQPATYLLRMKNADMINGFVEAVKKEVAELKK